MMLLGLSALESVDRSQNIAFRVVSNVAIQISKNFERWNPERAGPAFDSRHAIDHVRASDGLWARADVTRACGNSLMAI